MIMLALVPLALGLAAAVAIPRGTGALRPAARTVLLAGLALTISVATGIVLLLAGYVAFHEVRAQGGSCRAAGDWRSWPTTRRVRTPCPDGTSESS